MSDPVRRLNLWIGRVISWFNVLLILLVGIDVIFRYFLNQTSVWVMELEWHLFALIFLFGAAYTLAENRHVRVDVFYARFSLEDKAWVDFFGSILLLIPWCLVVIYYSGSFAWDAFILKETSPDPGGLPARYLIKVCIPLGFTLLLLQGISSAWESVQIIRKSRRLK